MFDHHKNLTNGVGKCSVPMWMGGCPAGFCDKPAFGNYIPGPMFRDAWTGERHRFDGKYTGYVPGLACEAHGGPPALHCGDPCFYCGTPHDDVARGACPKSLAEDQANG